MEERGEVKEYTFVSRAAQIRRSVYYRDIRSLFRTRCINIVLK